MGKLDEYAAFIAIVDHGSLTAAAQTLGRSLQAVSRSLASLEHELGVQLVARTTRRSEPTIAGIAFHARMKAALADIRLARDEAERHGETASGELRVGAPALFAPTHVVPVIAAFMRRWPEVAVELVLSDRVADLIDERIDVAVRIGDLPSSSLKHRPLARLRRVVFAAPAYLEKHGRPESPSDLAWHACAVRTIGPETDQWPLTVGGKLFRTPVRGAFRANDAAACNEAVAAGLGVGLAPFWQIRRLVDEGRVELLLAAHEPLPLPVSAVWPAAAQLPARTRLFIDTIAARFSAERW